MRTCSYCGKEYSDDISQCLVDGQPLSGGDTAVAIAAAEPPPILGSILSKPKLGSKLTERQLRIVELCIVCLVAFGGSILASFYVLWAPSSYSSSSGNLKWIYGILRAVFALILLWYILLRRSKDFSDIGLSWKGKSDFGWSIVISFAGSIAFNILYLTIYYSGLTTNSRQEVSSNVGHFLFSGGIVFATIAYQFVNPFLEELIVRAYVMTEVQELTNSATKAILISTILQTSYHFYQGVPAALSHAGTFLVFSIYFAKTKRILPVILAHLYADLGETLWYMAR